MIRTRHPSPREPEIIVTPHDIITIEARPPVSEDEIAYYSAGVPVRKLRGLRLLAAWAALFLLCCGVWYAILSPLARWLDTL